METYNYLLIYTLGPATGPRYVKKKKGVGMKKAYFNIDGVRILELIKGLKTNIPDDATFSHFFLDPNRITGNYSDYVSVVYSSDENERVPEGGVFPRKDIVAYGK